MMFQCARDGGWRTDANRARLGRFARFSAGVGLAALSGGAWIALAIREAPEVGASMSPAGDVDSDGLPDALENVLGTHATRADSDLDGWSDIEEIARGSHPMRAASVPGSEDVSVSMDAYRDGTRIHVVTVVYLPDGLISGKSLMFATAAGDEVKQVPLHWLAGGMATKVIPASGGGLLVVLDPVVSNQLVFARNGFTLCAVVSVDGTRVAADVADLRVIGTQIYEQVAKPSQAGQNGLQPSQSGPPNGLGVGGMYRPLMHDPGSPSPGEICAQTTVTVGVINGVVLQEVASADCVSGWDAFCAPGCSGMVGTQIKTVDPAALIGN
jgi:hypothetical protein